MFRFSLPFYAFRLDLVSGGSLLAPLADKGSIRVGEPLNLVAGKYAELLQSRILNEGKFRELLDEYQPGDYTRHTFSIVFPASKDGISFPPFTLEFDCFINEQANGFWGILPSLGLEAYAHSEKLLIKRLKETTRLEFARSKRFQFVQRIVSAIWFDQINLERYDIQLAAPTPQEIESKTDDQKDALLPQVAQPLKISRPVVYGRKQELEQLSRALRGKFGRNVLLVGPSGVGKTALVWELARQSRKKRVKGQIWETTASVMIKELMRETGWEDNLSKLCSELARTEDLLFIRNLMELFEVGKYEGNEVSMADYLRTFISQGAVSLISECTEEELARIDLESPNYLSFFQVIRLAEPKEEAELEAIILRKVRDMAKGRGILIGEEAIREVIRLHRRYTPYSGMPGKPIRFLESILINKKNEPSAKKGKKLPVISRSEVIRSFCEDTGMPLFMVDPHIPMDVRRIKADFNSMIFGQERAVNSLVDLLASIKTALTRTGKPIASFLFAGPTGVGKTELAKILAGLMFGKRERMVRFDMSEFSSPFSVMRLTGIHYFSNGLLTSAVRKDPFCVLLFDEIEKAHPNFFDLLLQLLSEGRLTDSQGKLVNFCSTIIIMTSNIGSESLGAARISYKKETDTQQLVDHFVGAVQKSFRPELFNRIDQVIPFEPLDALSIRFVVEREIELLKQREGIRFRRMDLRIEETVLDYLADKGYSSQYGARYLQRTIRELLITPLARALNLQDFEEQLIAQVSLQNNEVSISVEVDPLGLELLLEELDKINHADLASALRRSCNRLEEGHIFVQLLSAIDILERKKKKEGKKFWENRIRAERYSRLLQLNEQFMELQKQVEDYEMQLGLSCLDQKTFHPRLFDQIKEWENAFFLFKVDILAMILPERNTCHLGIYGLHSERIAEFYLRLLKNRGYNFSLNTIWFRDKYYNEEVVVSEKGTMKKVKREAYIKEMVSPGNKKMFHPPRSGDLLCGLELAINGPGAFIFLQPEEGLHHWKFSSQEESHFFIRVSNQVKPTPVRIHRQDFYKRFTVRRIVETDHLRDNQFKVNREYRKDELLPLIEEPLAAHFRQMVEREVY